MNLTLKNQINPQFHNSLNLIIQPQPHLLKKSLRILNPKLPKDFFGSKTKNILGLSDIHQRSQCIRTKTHSKINIQNKGIQRMTPGPLSSRSRNPSFQNQRNSQTANDQVGRQMKLIMDIIETNRQMRKAFRKHSVQLKNPMKQRRDGIYLQLPPLGLKNNLKGLGVKM